MSGAGSVVFVMNWIPITASCVPPGPQAAHASVTPRGGRESGLLLRMSGEGSGAQTLSPRAAGCPNREY